MPRTKWLSTAEFASQIGMSQRAVRAWCASGRIPGAVKIGHGHIGDWRIPIAGFHRFQKEECECRESGRQQDIKRILDVFPHMR